METALAAAAVAQRLKFRIVSGHPVVPEPLVTLRPKHGETMTVRKRA